MKCSLLIFTMFLAFSCKKEKEDIDNNTTNLEIINLVNSWNNNHNKDSAANFSNIYAENVDYYGTSTEKGQIIKDKEKLLKKYTDFNQSISENDFNIVDNAQTKGISFTKKVTFDSNQKDYPAYLVVSEINGKWKITTESDSITDKNLLNKTKQNIVKKTKTKDAATRKLYGDFNGDGQKEYAWVKPPERLDENYEIDFGQDDERGDLAFYCPGGCNSVIYFSDNSIVPITIEGSFGGSLRNLGDLNNDGSDNIGFWNNNISYAGTGSTLFVFTTKNSEKNYVNIDEKAHFLIEPIYVKLDAMEFHKIEKIVKKLDGNKLEITEVIGWDKPKTKIIQL